MAMRREVDPEARRLIAHLADLERRPWPAARALYADALVALSIRCETRGGKREVYDWFMAEGLRAVQGLSPVRRAHLQDAVHEMVATAPGLLLRFRAGLDDRRQPHLKSMLVRWVSWKAKDFCASTYTRHARREVPWPPGGFERVSETDPFTACRVREVIRALVEDGSPVAWALVLVAQGASIAEAARRTGVSRQRIYRRRDQIAREE